MEREQVLAEKSASFARNMRLSDLTGSEILQFIRAVDLEITWLSDVGEGKLWALVAKPKSIALTDGFGLNRELLILCSSFPQLEPRDLNHRNDIEAALQTPGRLDSVTLVISGASDCRDVLRKLEGPRETLLGISPAEISEALKSGHPSERFRGILQERLYARDFFDRSGPVDGDDFFGRDKLLQDIALQLERGSHVGLYGLRKVGKTSLIKVLLERRPQLLPKAKVLHLDLLSVLPANRSYTYLLFQIASEMRKLGLAMKSSQRWPRFEVIPTSAEFERAFDGDFRSALDALAAKGMRLILVLDEIERLFPSSDLRVGFEGYEAFLGYVRGISQSAGPLSLLVVGVNPNVSEAEYLGKRQNPMFGFFSNRYAPPMTLEEVREMVRVLGRSSGARFSSDATAAIYTAVGGHPFLIRKYCSLLVKDRVRPADISADDVVVLEEAFLREETSHFAEMVSVVKEFYPDEFRVLHQIAVHDGIAADSVNRRILAHLEGYQLVSTSAGKITMRYRLMREWLIGVTGRVAAEVGGPIVPLSNQASGGPAGIDQELVADTIRDVELTLRRLVRAVLERRWAAKAEKRIEAAIGPDGMKAARDRLEKSLRFRDASETAAEEILEFLYIGDLQRIALGNEWQEFRQIFADKRETERNLQIIASCRNEVQHFRTLSSRELLKAYVAGAELLDAMRGAEQTG